jgi:hypothetical protein
MGKYQHKIVLVVASAGLFRHKIENVFESLMKVNLTDHLRNNFRNRTDIKTQDDLDYAFKLYRQLAKMTDYELRVESPWISIYTNSKKDVNSLIGLGAEHVKYVSSPADTLVSGEILLPKVPFEYKVTLGKTVQEHSTFLQWADVNDKVKVTKSCRRELTRDYSWGGTYFYISGDKMLLMARMHLGGSITKVERIKH